MTQAEQKGKIRRLQNASNLYLKVDQKLNSNIKLNMKMENLIRTKGIIFIREKKYSIF